MRPHLALTTHLRQALLGLALLASGAGAQTTGLVPLNDLGSGTHAGYAGGLYPGGANTPPAAHLAAALAEAAQVVPRDAAGAVDPNGWIGMIAVGMSNTTHEFAAFERNADTTHARNARVLLIDTAMGGMSASLISNPAASFWTTMSQRVLAMGLAPAQVQVAWLKEAEIGPPDNFPLHAQALRDTLAHIVQILREKYPNLRLCYLSSRIYGGYTQGATNPEPQAYESGFSVKWLIERQAGGDPALNFDPGLATVRAPLLLWGPYLWADGVHARSDGLTWPLSDFESDHLHPAASGEQKVARLLADFFASDTTAASWWRAQGGAQLRVIDALHDSYVSSANPATSYGAAGVLLAGSGADVRHTYLRFELPVLGDPPLFAKLSLRVASQGGGTLRPVSDPAWDEGTLTYTNAPLPGATLASIPSASRDGTIGLNVTATVAAHLPGPLALALSAAAVTGSEYLSKEAGHSPRLVLVVPASTVGVAPGIGSTSRGWLRSVSPNPARGVARISCVLPAERAVDLAVYGVDGRRVRTLARETWSAGGHELAWDGRDAAGRDVRPGVYLVRLASAGVGETRRIAWLR